MIIKKISFLIAAGALLLIAGCSSDTVEPDKKKNKPTKNKVEAVTKEAETKTKTKSKVKDRAEAKKVENKESKNEIIDETQDIDDTAF